MWPVLDPARRGDKPLEADLLVHQGGVASRCWVGWGDGNGRMGKGAEFRTGCELVACGPVQVDTGMWVQSAEGTWAGDTAWGTHRQKLWEADRTGRHGHLGQGRCSGTYKAAQGAERGRRGAGKNNATDPRENEDNNRNHVVGVSVFYTLG